MAVVNMLIPTGQRSYLNDLTGTPARVMGAGAMPVNFQTDDGAWSEIDLSWETVSPTRWRAVRGDHRAVVDSTLGIQYSKRGPSGVRHALGMQPRFLVKLRRSDLTWSNIATAASPVVTIAGGVLTAANVFPDIDLELDYFNDSYSHRWVFHQAARTALAGAGPWAGHLIGVVTELDPSALNLQWRDSAGTFDPAIDTRFHTEWIDAHEGGVRVFALARNVLQYDAFDMLAPNPIPVHKFIGKRNGTWWLIELFDPLLTTAIPEGDLWHNATFGNETEEIGATAVADTCRSLGASPASSGTLDQIKAFAQPIVALGQTLYYAAALYQDGSPPLGSGASPSTEISTTFGDISFAWRTFTMSGESLTSGATYYLAAWSSKVSTTTKLNIRAGTGGDCKFNSTVYNYSGWDDLGSSNTLKLSIYAVYTEAGGGGPPLGSLALMGVGR